jgi:hypothetical protein
MMLQLIPLGLDVTLPLPVPLPVTVSRWVVSGAVKVAVTVRAWLIVTWQLPAPLQAPDQPAKVWPLAGMAVSVIRVPLL